MMELNKVYKFTYHYNCCCHIVIKEKIHVNIKTNNKICVTLYDLVSQQKYFGKCPVTDILLSDDLSSLSLLPNLLRHKPLKDSLFNHVLYYSFYSLSVWLENMECPQQYDYNVQEIIYT